MKLGTAACCEGYRADVTIFDPDDFRDRATYAEPHQYPTGKRTTVIVNGTIVVDNAIHTGALPGMVLRRDRDGYVSLDFLFDLIFCGEPTMISPSPRRSAGSPEHVGDDAVIPVDRLLVVLLADVGRLALLADEGVVCLILPSPGS